MPPPCRSPDRSPRSGRAGREGFATTFFTESDAPRLRSIAGVMHASGCAIPAWMLDLGKNEKARKKIAHQTPNRKAIKTGLGSKAADKAAAKAKSRKRKRSNSGGKAQAEARAGSAAGGNTKSNPKPAGEGKSSKESKKSKKQKQKITPA